MALPAPTSKRLRTAMTSTPTAWEVLDFGDIEANLAKEMTDGDVHSMLSYINAKRTVKTLRLTGLVNITGRCLGPLRRSTVLKALDLSLVGFHQPPLIDPEPLISDEVVLPILHSIVDRCVCSLKFIQLPHKWREMSPSSELTAFLKAFDRRMKSYTIHCSHCKDLLDLANTDDWEEGAQWCSCNEDHYFYGLQNFTCAKSLLLLPNA
ncbi:LOW QUALITY PROTEIN: hypothetical protein ACHAXT_010454 [Thalassiosira profunda]